MTLPHGANGDALAQALVHLPVTLRRAELQADGARPVLLAMQAAGRASYLFHDLTPADAADIAATVAAYLDAPDGWIVDARPCGRLRLCLKTRIPSG
ncbi:DUF1636 family protein [Paracoccus laeviglucosivorans]|uniref:DUF1636 family protein n=1 Tax=Paracoccus laeviglucosivorans TaxID=1197861 RepID=UPI001FE9CBFF|nr:DUF1636 family protein [Paracoccus laeviglucosivorans]